MAHGFSPVPIWHSGLEESSAHQAHYRAHATFGGTVMFSGIDSRWLSSNAFTTKHIGDLDVVELTSLIRTKHTTDLLKLQLSHRDKIIQSRSDIGLFVQDMRPAIVCGIVCDEKKARWSCLISFNRLTIRKGLTATTYIEVDSIENFFATCHLSETGVRVPLARLHVMQSTVFLVARLASRKARLA